LQLRPLEWIDTAREELGLKKLEIGGDSTDLDYDLQTKTGEPLRFVYTDCVPGTNRCFKLDEIAAYIGEKKSRLYFGRKRPPLNLRCVHAFGSSSPPPD
jgi:hypothetical protein